MNALVNETSPYLLQHKNNPVEWFPWGQEAFEKAKKENKLVLVSIGYSACHWCHVMEHECFEDAEVAALMNQYFVNIKVDREERPDVDQIYMEAVQLMNKQGGWPLNCFTLPNGKPFFGGTYFPKQNWMSLLHQLVKLQKDEPEKLEEYSSGLTERIEEGAAYFSGSDKAFTKDVLFEGIVNWSRYFDTVNGGIQRAPKFPLPASQAFLLKTAHLTENKKLLNHVYFTMDKMAQGGIYDQIGGGFSRYSVDEKWKVPHFEKMLYDNAQLVSLYAEAYQISGNEEYKRIVQESITFCLEELYDDNKGFYCALDADSEGVEGKYYVWSSDELKEILKEDYSLVSDYFNINEAGAWEGNYIPLRTSFDAEYSETHKIEIKELEKRINSIKQRLKIVRDQRIKPGLDNKVLTSWNALMIIGLTKASVAVNDDKYLELAKKTMVLLLKNHINDEGLLVRTLRGGNPIDGFLDDYALTIEALIELYKVDFNEYWITRAKELVDISLDRFYDEKIGAFYYNARYNGDVVAKKIDMHDDVIPSSNSVMAHNLFLLSLIYDNSYYRSLSEGLLKKTYGLLTDEMPNFSNWARLLTQFVYPFTEIVITGSNAHETAKKLSKQQNNNMLIIASTNESALPIFKNRFRAEENNIFVCKGKTCLPPMKKIEEVLAVIS